jgi:hypothetical protein
VARALFCALLLLLLVPHAAAAAPLKVTPRLVVGDSRHYIEALHITMAMGTDQAATVDLNTGLTMEVEEVLDDGTARVRQTIDSVDVGDNSSLSADMSDYVGQSFTSIVHQDGSISDFQRETSDGPEQLAGAEPMTAMFPSTGLEVGQSFDASTAFPALLPGVTVPPVPVHTKLDAVVDGQSQPAARLIQTMRLPDTEVPFGPFGASGTGKISGNSYQVVQVALDTGWPIRDDGVVAYSLTVTTEKQQQSADVRMEIHMVMDNQALVADD